MDKFQILCLSGGGFRGLYTATILAHLENHFGKPIHECFDLICGTSIGGVIATGLAFKTPASDIQSALLNNGDKIFKKDTGITSWLKRYKEAPYKSDELKASIEKLLPSNAKIGDASIPYLTTAVNLHTGKPRVFKTPHHKDFFRDKDLSAVDTALATSAAPLFFPPAIIESESFVDGGLFANSPELIGIHEAEHYLDIDINKIHVLSVGTTGKTIGLGHNNKNKWGIKDWMRNKLIIELTFSSQQGLSSNLTMHKLGERYSKIDETHSDNDSFSFGMDDVTPEAISHLETMANRSYMTAGNDKKIKAFFEHKPNRNGLEYNKTTKSSKVA